MIGYLTGEPYWNELETHIEAIPEENLRLGMNSNFYGPLLIDPYDLLCLISTKTSSKYDQKWRKNTLLRHINNNLPAFRETLLIYLSSKDKNKFLYTDANIENLFLAWKRDMEFK